MRTSHCIECKKEYPMDKFIKEISGKDLVVVKCSHCGNIVKPDIVFFGENLPNEFFDNYSKVI